MNIHGMTCGNDRCSTLYSNGQIDVQLIKKLASWHYLKHVITLCTNLIKKIKTWHYWGKNHKFWLFLLGTSCLFLVRAIICLSCPVGYKILLISNARRIVHLTSHTIVPLCKYFIRNNPFWLKNSFISKQCEFSTFRSDHV